MKYHKHSKVESIGNWKISRAIVARTYTEKIHLTNDSLLVHILVFHYSNIHMCSHFENYHIQMSLCMYTLAQLLFPDGMYMYLHVFHYSNLYMYIILKINTSKWACVCKPWPSFWFPMVCTCIYMCSIIQTFICTSILKITTSKWLCACNSQSWPRFWFPKISKA